ncbi:hypothetical protein DID88_001109 [Monilinia fructigena]|uniref:Helicase C-terminal domain-containing protein n=1 Tax=Monilinia fructigena TaxID=38457 RepID=A0A395J0C6_9HELO|nr:hypothetical protein DID88_001109 [Monilinia fructigena]
MDECHLTITTSEYRSCMTQVGWFIRQIRTQSVWLSATLPPVMEELFIEQNKLVSPQIVRESTNRSNLQYLVSYGDGVPSLMEKARELIEVCWPDPNIFDQSCDKIIIYCRTRDVASAVAELMDCPLYTSESGTIREKGEIIQRWLSNPHQPVIAATSALGIGFDYPHIRWVIHLDAPERVTAFSQESGRAGRDGRKASSIILLDSAWRPQRDTSLPPDQATMQLYLTQQYCSRGVLSQFLDRPSDWRWCMSSDEVCQVCREPHEEPRPPHLIYTLNPSTTEIESTGPREIHAQDFRQDQILDRYEQDLLTFHGSCLYCRIRNRRFDHLSSQCSRRSDWIHAKGEALQACQFDERDWMPRYIVCWNCYQPQEICRVADPEHEEIACRFPDMVMPLCHGVYKKVGGLQWLRRHFQRTFETELEYMLWLGETTSLGPACAELHAGYASARRRAAPEQERKRRDMLSTIRNAKRDYWRRVIDSAADDADLYKVVGWHKLAPSLKAPPLIVNGVSIESTKEKAEALLEKVLHRYDDSDDLEYDPLEAEGRRPILPWTTAISLEEVEKSVIGVSSTSPGADRVTVRLLKACWQHIRATALYASGMPDDIAIYRASKSVESNVTMLKRDVRQVMRWGAENKVAFAPEKLEMIHLSRKRNTNAPSIRVSPELTITPVTAVGDEQPALRWLGVWIDRKLSFKRHVAERSTKALKLHATLKG